MGIFKNAVYSKIDVFVKFESAINLEIKVQIKKKPWIPFIWVTRITFMYSLYLTIVMIIIKCCIMFVAGISVEMFTTASTLFFLIEFVKKTRNNTVLIFLYVLVNP